MIKMLISFFSEDLPDQWDFCACGKRDAASRRPFYPDDPVNSV
jgi:hypothetical protein